jgi:hypothetical protein
MCSNKWRQFESVKFHLKTHFCFLEAHTYYPYVEALYSCPLFGERFAMTIQTVYCEDESVMPEKYRKLMQKTRNIRSLQKERVKTIDIATRPTTSKNSMYNNVYLKSEGEMLTFFIKSMF